MKSVKCEKCNRSKEIPDDSEGWFCSCGARVSKCSSIAPKKSVSRGRCVFLGDAIETIDCNCPIKPKIYECEVHEKCITHKNFSEKTKNLMVCEDCDKWESFY